MKRKRGLLFAGLCLILAAMGSGIFREGARTAMAATALPVSGHVILVDAGHGGSDPGKTGSLQDEKDINLKIASYLQSYLEMGGASVIITRLEDEMLSEDGSVTKKGDMRQRGELIRQSHPDLVVSIHQNSYPGSSCWGPQVFYWQNSAEGKRAAEQVQTQLNIFTGGTRSDKANGEYYILRQSEDTAILVECGFLTNPEEEKKLNDPAYQKRIAWSIYAGINRYFEEEENEDTMGSDGGSRGSTLRI